MYPAWLNDTLRCPETGKTLQSNGVSYVSDRRKYKMNNGILSAVYPTELSGYDAKYNKLYNFLAPLYDLNERIGGKLLFGIDMIKGRKQIISLLGLKPGMRVLEVSPGPGVFQKFLKQEISDTGELVTLDLSMGMLRQCQSNINGLFQAHPLLFDYKTIEGEFLRYKGRIYCWVNLNNSTISFSQEMLKTLDLKIGDKLLSIRGSDIAFVMGVKGPLIERANKSDKLIELFLL